MINRPRGKSNTRRWLMVLACGSLFTAATGTLLLLSSGRGWSVVERMLQIKRGGNAPDVRIEVQDRIIDREVVREVEVPVAANGDSGKATSSYDARKLYNGIRLEAKLDKQDGQAASLERAKDESYAVSLTLHVRAPQPVTDLAGLELTRAAAGNPLPGLVEMLPKAKVSPYYARLYANKEARLLRNLLTLDKLLSRHNYFDCETILEMQHPASGRKVLLMQAEMDVVSDGSDGDRLPEMPDNIVKSSFYQPTTSYAWPKTSDTPNPLLAGIEARVKKAKDEFAIRGLTAERNAELKASIDEGTRLIGELKRRSYLIAEYDPFMVLPVFMVTDREAKENAVRIGDYAAVIHGNRIFPAIVGDAGPDFKVGEASMRIAREIDPATNPYRRPVSDLKVTYLVFPGTAEPTKAAPDLVQWKARCAALLQEIGGLSPTTSLHDWDDILKRMAAEREAKRLAEEEAKRKAAEELARQAAEKARAEAAARAASSGSPPVQGTTPEPPATAPTTTPPSVPEQPAVPAPQTPPP